MARGPGSSPGPRPLSGLEILRGHRPGTRLLIPCERGDPPASVLLDELEGIDAATDDVLVIPDVLLVGAEDVGHVAELFGYTGHVRFREPAVLRRAEHALPSLVDPGDERFHRVHGELA